MSRQTRHSGSSRTSSISLRVISPYAFTRTGIAGEKRESMLRSELQTLPELGKSHRRGHKIPPPQFTYGVGSPRHDGGVPAALFYPPEKERAANPDFEFVRDYTALNKAALEAGMISARDQSRFRTIHDIKRKISIREVSLSKNKLKLPDNMVFGKPSRPSTPIEDVLRHSFSDKWLESMVTKEANLKKDRADNTSAFKGGLHTKTSLLRQAKVPVDEKPLWKMEKFAYGEHQVDSFRSESERRKAISANTSDAISRQGTYHTGIYNVPRTTVQI